MYNTQTQGVENINQNMGVGTVMGKIPETFKSHNQYYLYV